MGAKITRGHTYGSTDTVTSSNLHDLVDDATITGIDQTNLANNYGTVITGGTAPSDTDALWRDSGNSNVIKYWNGSAWTLVTSSGTASITDADADTKIQVEESSDEDIIRMDNAGTETFVLNADGVLSLPKQSGCHATQVASNQTVTTATWAKVVLDNEVYDVQGEFDNATNYRFVAGVTGYYAIHGSIVWSSTNINSGELCYIAIYKNGTLVSELQVTQHASLTDNLSLNISGILSLDATDYIELYAYHEFGANGTIILASLNVHKIA